MSFAWGMGGMSMMFVLFPFVFALVIGVFIAIAVKGIFQWNRNNQSPVLSVIATVVSKRTNVSHMHHHQGGGVEPGAVHTSSSTSYYATFQVESGDRMELSVSGRQYGQLAEGDVGKLTFQGTRFLDFQRSR